MGRCAGYGLACVALAAVIHGIRAGMIQFPEMLPVLFFWLRPAIGVI
jgi:hypothetical protein